LFEPKGHPKKRGRKPKIVLPTLEILPELKPEKKEGKKKVSKIKTGKKAVKKAAAKKKSTKEVIPALVKEVKVEPKKMCIRSCIQQKTTYNKIAVSGSF